MSRAPSLVLLAALWLATAGCSVGGRADRILARSDQAGLSDRAVHAWVDEFRRSLVRQVRDFVFAAYQDAEDWEQRQRALFVGIFVDRETARAAGRDDGYVAMVDIWALVRQLEQYFDEGEGAETFAAHREQILEMLAVYDEQAATGMQQVGDPELRARAEEIVARWVVEWPIKGHRPRRVSTAPLLVELFRKRDGDVFDRVASMEETAERIEQIVGDLTFELPVQIALEATLVVDGYLQRLEASGIPALLERLVAAFEALPAWLDAQRAATVAALDAMRAETIEDLGRERAAVCELLSAERAQVVEVLQQERATALAEVDRQRLETVEAAAAIVAAERTAVLAAVERLRADTIADLRAERVAAVDDVEAMRSATIAQFDGRLGELVERSLDGLFWRVLALLGLGGAGLAALTAWVVRRTARR